MPNEIKPAAEAEHGERKHHPYSPSSIKLFASCPKYLKREGTNAAADRGTACHEAADSGDFSKLTQRETDGVRAYLQVISDVKEEFPDCEELVEERVAIDADETTAGFFDRALWCEASLTIVGLDLKAGQGAIDPVKHNWQAKSYLLGLWRKFPRAKNFRFVFITPFQDKLVDDDTFTEEELRLAYEEIVEVVARAKAAGASDTFDMAEPHNGVCRFCGHLKDCPKGSGLMSEMGKHMPVAFIDPTVMLTSEEPEELGRIMDLMRYLEDYMKPVRNRITEMAKQGKPPEGYELVSVATREVVNEDAVATALLMELKDLGLTEEEAFEKVRSAYTVRLSTAESILSDSAAKGKKRAAKAKFGETLLVTGAVSYTAPKTWLKRITKAIVGGDAFEAKGDDWI